jgi:hypothetical protein
MKEPVVRAPLPSDRTVRASAPHVLPFLVAACFAIPPGLALACTPHVEEHAADTTATFRPHTSAFESCEVSEATYREVVGEWLRKRATDASELSSLSLGRAVAFPWISRHVADAALRSPNWAARVARAKPGERDRLAAPFLQDPALLRRLAAPFEGTRYSVVGISFEKILFGSANEYSSDRGAGKVLVPFDAQLWLRLKPRPASAP